MPQHGDFHKELLMFKNLMTWLHRSNCFVFDSNQQRLTYFNSVKRSYIEKIHEVYSQEIIPFCLCARQRVSKDKVKQTSTRVIHLLDKEHTNSPFTIRIDGDTKKMLTLVFSKLLNQLSDAVQNEQLFCQEFFNTLLLNEQSRTDRTESSGSASVTLTKNVSSASLTSTLTNKSDSGKAEL
jgi:hypothetical protein